MAVFFKNQTQNRGVTVRASIQLIDRERAITSNRERQNSPTFPGANPIAAPIFNLYKNPREDRPQDAIQYGVGFGAKFVQMVKRHMGMKQQYPDGAPARDVPYGGIVNLRPESKALVETFKAGKPNKTAQ